MSNLLAQSQELKRLRKESERRGVEDEEERVMREGVERGREVEEFERTQAGLGVRGEKRKRRADVEDGFKHAEGEKAAKRRASDKEGSGEDLPSFWVPGKIPENQKADVKAIKVQPTCPAAAVDQSHAFTLKTLVAVKFIEDEKTGDKAAVSTTADGKVRSCPSCDKALSNSTKAVLAKPCGHVLCKPCSDKFQKPPEKSAHEEHDETARCYVCQEDVTPGRKVKQKDGKEGKEKGKVERGLVELSSDGTGFAGGGKNMVKKRGVAFQC